ncbi:MAG: hypothetical protein HQM10_26670 [Candidatus Riflebacteria bacterium]|nr:hypothetical protein [Candidatus Riflebacteria bacterium]
MKKIIGIDPGQQGGIAIFEEDEMKTMAMPLIGKEIDIAKIREYIFSSAKPDKAVIEKVHAMPKQGVSSTFTFGKGYGELIGLLKAFGIPYIEVSPMQWKKKVLSGIDWKKRKGSIMRICHESLPRYRTYARKKEETTRWHCRRSLPG